MGNTKITDRSNVVRAYVDQECTSEELVSQQASNTEVELFLRTVDSFLAQNPEYRNNGRLKALKERCKKKIADHDAVSTAISTCASAADGGHLEVLQWARANGATWDKRTCAQAANSGHLNLLRWAIENGCPVGDQCVHYLNQKGQQHRLVCGLILRFWFLHFWIVSCMAARSSGSL